MFIRKKKVKGHHYAYVVSNRWTKKGSRQKVSRYLGKIIGLDPIRAREFEEMFSYNIEDQDSFTLLCDVISLELYNHGFEQRKPGLWVLDDIFVDFKKGNVRRDKKDIVLQLGNDFFSTFTLRRLLRFKSDKDENGVATDLAKGLIQAGIPIRQDLFVALFRKIYSPGQSFMKKPKVRLLPKRIIVTGTPGTGKTTIAKSLAGSVKGKYIDVNKVIEEYGLEECFDKKRDAKVVDISKLVSVLQKIIKSSLDILIIDSHLSHHLPRDKVDICIVARCSLKELKKRLEARGYSKSKVRENLDSEIFEICLQESIEKGHNIMQIWTDKGIDIDKVVDTIWPRQQRQIN